VSLTTKIIGVIAGSAVMLACASLIPEQRYAFGEKQSLILLGGQVASFVCLASIVEIRKKNKQWMIPALIWLSFIPILLAVAYVRLPSSRAARYETRVHEAADRAEAYRSQHSGKSCPPLEAELIARKHELQASRIRAGGLRRYRSSSESVLASVGAVAAAIMAGLSFLVGRERSGTSLTK
jgi:hypothetical protein